MTYASPSTINASEGFISILNYINTATNNWISNILLMAIYAIIAFSYYKTSGDFSGAMASAGFVTFIVGLLFWMGGFVTGWALSITVAILIIGVIAILMDKR